MKIARIDHLVLTVHDIDATCAFYKQVLGMSEVTYDGRRALSFGQQKINLHQAGAEFTPHAQHPTAGSGDICLIAAVSLDEVIDHLRECSVEVIEGPVERTGAVGTLRSVYFRDPDQNLIEVSEYLFEMPEA